MPRIQVDSLRQFITEIFEKHGTPRDSAECVSDHLVRSDRAGHPSHGVIRLQQYIDEIQEGRLVPTARPEIAQQTSVSALIDGQHGFGQVTATYALDVGLRIVREHGLGAVATTRSRHIGRVGEFPERAAQRGLIGMIWANGMRSPAAVAPYGGRTGRHGTNPIAMAAPRGPDQPPVVADFATSIVAEGKLRVARNRGQEVSSHLIMDRDGKPTTNPQDFYDGGCLRTLGEHKGFCLSFMCDILAGALTGSLTPCFPNYSGSNSLMMILLDPDCFRSRDAFQKDVDRLCDIVKSTPTEDGFEEVFVPGELEHRRLEVHADTLSLDEPTWHTLRQIAVEHTLNFPQSVE